MAVLSDKGEPLFQRCAFITASRMISGEELK